MLLKGWGDMVSNLLIDRLVNILREKDFNIAAQELENITDLDSFGSENFFTTLYLKGGYTGQKMSHLLLQGISGKAAVR